MWSKQAFPVRVWVLSKFPIFGENWLIYKKHPSEMSACRLLCSHCQDQLGSSVCLVQVSVLVLFWSLVSSSSSCQVSHLWDWFACPDVIHLCLVVSAHLVYIRCVSLPACARSPLPGYLSVCLACWSEWSDFGFTRCSIPRTLWRTARFGDQTNNLPISGHPALLSRCQLPS